MPRLRQVPRSEAPEGIVSVMYKLLFGERDPVAEPGTETGTPGNWWFRGRQFTNNYSSLLRPLAIA